MERASRIVALLAAGCLAAPPAADSDGGPPDGDGGGDAFAPLCPSEGIVGHWRFDGDLSTVVDSAGGHDGSIAMESPLPAPGMFGQAAEFRSSPDNGYVVVPDDDELDLPSGSLEIWVWFSGTGQDEAFFSRDASFNPATDDNGHLRIRRSADQYIQVRVQVADGDVQLRSQQKVPERQWTWIVVNWGGGTVELHVDALSGDVEPSAFGWGNSIRPIVFGADQANAPEDGGTGTPMDYLDGRLDEIVLCSEPVEP